MKCCSNVWEGSFSLNSQAGSRKKRKNKRQASSPLIDNNGLLNTDLPIFKSVSVRERRTGQSKVCKQDGAAANTQTVRVLYLTQIITFKKWLSNQYDSNTVYAVPTPESV